MIYFLSDQHGGESYGEIQKYLDTAGEDDLLIILGDLGLKFQDTEENRAFDEFILSAKKKIAFIDGNHENFDALNAYPVEKWKGGNVHRIRNNIFHLMRGQIFRIGGQSIFVMGGAYSRDRAMRTEGLSYWRAELPSREEYEEAARNLALHRFSVDYIISHTAPREIIRRMGRQLDPHDAELTGFLEWIMYETEYKEWFFGHWHTEKTVGNHRALWFDVVEV